LSNSQESENQIRAIIQAVNIHFITFTEDYPDKARKTDSFDSQNKLVSNNPKSPGERFTGDLKFFDEKKNYGFLVMDLDKSDIFVHYDDLLKANITKETLSANRTGIQLKFSFSCMNYIGKYNKSRKAVDLELISPSNIPTSNSFPQMADICFSFQHQ
jgi:cold shock CspA family protein